MNKVSKDIKALTKQYADMWWHASSALPPIATFTCEQQAAKEKEFEAILDSIDSHLDSVPSDEDGINEWKTKLKTTILHHAQGNLSMSNETLERSMLDSFMSSADDFINSAMTFDRSLAAQDVYQALRNVWIMNLIQMMSDNTVSCTPSVFAYSLLYPYTDNYLDCSDIPTADKLAFNERLAKRLHGEDVSPTCTNESKVYSLIDTIEQQYPRDKYPNIYDSILGIHTAQCRSLAQQCTDSSPYQYNILDISCQKGGTSVLADAYLVCGELDEILCDYMFGFGVVLQLVDDLQDAKSDLADSSMTIYSQTIQTHKLDSIANKLISYTIDCLGSQRYDIHQQVQTMIVDNSILLVINAILANRDLFSKEYIINIQKHFPVSYRYIRKSAKKIKKLQKHIKSVFAHIQ